jgi:hypothetical protein
MKRLSQRLFFLFFAVVLANLVIVSPTLAQTPAPVRPVTPSPIANAADREIKNGLNLQGYYISPLAKAKITEPDFEKNLEALVKEPGDPRFVVQVAVLDTALLKQVETANNGDPDLYARTFKTSSENAAKIEINIVVDAELKRIGLSSLLLDFHSDDLYQIVKDSQRVLDTEGYTAAIKTLVEKSITRTKEISAEARQQKDIERGQKDTHNNTWFWIIGAIMLVGLGAAIKFGASVWDVIEIVFTGLWASDSN